MELAGIQADALKIPFLGGNAHHTAQHAARQGNVRPPAQPVEGNRLVVGFGHGKLNVIPKITGQQMIADDEAKSGRRSTN